MPFNGGLVSEEEPWSSTRNSVRFFGEYLSSPIYLVFNSYFFVHFCLFWDGLRLNPLSGQGLFYRLIVQSLRGLYILHSRLFPLFSLDARKPLLFDLSWSIDNHDHFVLLFRLRPTMLACRCAQPCFAALQILFYLSLLYLRRIKPDCCGVFCFHSYTWFYGSPGLGVGH